MINRFTIVMICFFAGCGGPKLESVVPASGVLTYKGKPLVGYKITVFPTGDLQSASAISEEEGRFKLGCNVPGDGSPPGTHRINVVFVSEVAEGESGKETFRTLIPKIKVPKKYEAPETSGIELVVPPSGSTELKIELD